MLLRFPHCTQLSPCPPRCMLLLFAYALSANQGPPIMRNAWRTQTMCSQCGQTAAKPTPIWSPEILSDVVSDKRASLLAQPDGGLVPTLVLWPQHADSTPPVLYCGQIYLAHYWQQLHKHTHAHADWYQPPSLHGGDQLAGNEAKKHWRMWAALWAHPANFKSHTHVKLPHSHLFLRINTCDICCNIPFDINANILPNNINMNIRSHLMECGTTWSTVQKS